MSAICVIPARGGSKRIPRKNIRNFCGKPMIVWSIEAAQKSALFDRVVVSTDDEEIASVAMSCGIEVPFLRPSDLSDDFTPTRPVVNHAIREDELRYGLLPTHVCVIYATAPFLRVEDLTEGYQRLVNTGADFAFSVTSYNYPIQRAIMLTKNGGVAMFQPEHRFTRSQDLEPAYHDAGQFYWGRTEAFLNDQDTFSDRSEVIVLPSWRVVDIDNEEDWQRAELIFRAIDTSFTQ